MRARRYTDIIEIWESVEMPDGFGGFVLDPVKQFEKWTGIVTKGSGYKFQQYGLNDFKNPVIFRIRKGNSIITEDMFVIFNGGKFIIKGIENVNLDNIEINLYCDET